jgi:flagellar biosynthesis/type III secretory pathway chaperone
MRHFEEENEQPAPLLDLLINQCDHLEELMGLMRKQLDAMRSADSSAVTSIRDEQDELGKKLEISQQRIDRKML